MKQSQMHLDYETSDYAGFEFDPQMNFSEFLEEARQHASEVNFHGSYACPEEVGKNRSDREKKSKKSWINSLFSWWKAEKKRKVGMDHAANGPQISKPSKGYASGPIYGSSRGVDTRRQRPSSGPLTILLNSTKQVKNDQVPYMSLDHLNNPHHVNAYGPVYLVT